MVTFNTYTAPWTVDPTDAIIGPDGNLWVVAGNGNVYKFDTTLHTTTTYAVTNAVALISLCTDGTFIYASDQQANTATGNVMVYQITTSGTPTAFLVDADNGGSLYFDSTDIWLTSRTHFRQIDTSGAVLATYSGPSNQGGSLINDGAYWFSGTYSSAGTGVSRSPVGSPGSWTNFTTGFTANQQTYATVEAAGTVWVGNDDQNIFGLDPSTGGVTPYLTTTSPPGQCNQLCDDGTSLWAAMTSGGIWQTTTANPAVGTDYALPATTILYDAPTQMIWATGAPVLSGRVYSAFVGQNNIIMVI